MRDQHQRNPFPFTTRPAPPSDLDRRALKLAVRYQASGLGCILSPEDVG
jgi:hypothetical protein